MTNGDLTLQEIEQRLQTLAQEECNDEVALREGKIEHGLAVERSVYRQAEKRWLEMEALLLGPANHSKFAFRP
jgi:hypothetical protein